jgi:hypothetical protein
VNCLDAETLAAWMDGGLKGAPLHEVEAHVAGCDRCQMLLGAMGRTRAGIPAAPPATAPRRWLAWAVPLAAAATAIAIWVAIPQQRRAPQISQPAASTARAESERSVQPFAPAAPPTTAAQSPSERQPARLEPDTVSRQAESRPALAPPPSSAAAKTPAAPKTIDAPLPQAPTQEAAAVAPLQKSEAAGDVAQAAPVAAAPPQSRAEQAAPAAANGIAGRVAALASPPAPSIQMLCGSNWTMAPADVAARLIAGSSPSPDICWVVGRGGVIRLSTNRQTWQPIRFIDMTDLSAVQAFDARTATVTTADGRTFRTSDGGVSWH